MSRSPSPVIRRANRTYGRRRDTSDHEMSFDGANTSIDSHEDSYSSTSLALDNDVPPSSDDVDAWKSSPLGSHAAEANAPEDDDEDEPDRSPSKYHFAWQDTLRQIDAGNFELDADPSARAPYAKPSEGRATVPTRPASPEDGAVADPFGGTLSSLTNSSRPSSVIVHNRTARRVGAVLASEPDSETEDRPATPQSSPRHPINTPQAQSSPTPPTSIEMQDKKGKGKQRAVNPLQFEASEELASGSQISFADKRKKRKASNAPKRVKAPTKKEQLETKKATARIVAEQPVSVPRMQQNAYRLGDLLELIRPSITRGKMSPPPSDPIQTFSSPGARAEYDLKQASSSGSVNAEFKPNGLLGGSGDSDDDFPDVSAFKQQDEKKRGEEETRRAALELKKRALEQRNAMSGAADDSDDDLVIADDPQTVVHDEERARRVMAMHGIHPSKARQKQLAMAAPRRAHASLSVRDEHETRRLLEIAAASKFVAPSSKQQSANVISEPMTLNRILLHRNANAAQRIVREKEEDWKRRGGKIKQQPGDGVTSIAPGELLKAIVEKQKAHGNTEDADMAGDDDSDDDYRPGDDEAERRSQQSEGEGDENIMPGPSRGDPGDQADDEGENENPFVAPRQRRSLVNARHRPIVAVVSDDEEDVENGPPPLSASLAPESSLPRPAQSRQAEDAMDEDRSNPHRGSISSVGERTEDGTDKENDIRLSFDRGENKENTIVAVQSPSFSLRMSRGFGSLFVPSAQGSPAARSTADGVRSPLKELPPDDEDSDDPFVLGPTPGPLRLSSPPPAAADPILEASPMALSGGGGLEPAFSLSNKGKQRARASSPELLEEVLPIGGGGGFSQFFTQEGGGGFEKLKAAQQDDDISLTMDTGVRPVLEVDQSLVKKADELFEKEQELVVQEHQAALDEPKPQLFVDENGFLTQTRPQIRSPLNMMTPSQFTSLRLSSPATLLSSVRKPLAPLLSQAPDDDDEDDIDENLPRRRLRRRSESPTPVHNSSPAVTKPRNAFDVLGRRAPSPKLKPKQKLERSAFIEGEAEESDDDAAFGFGAKRKDDDDEEDGEDQDQVLAELVDDKEIDEKTLAEEAVLEKVREHQEEDDKALEKVHLDAIQGKFRVKRKDYGIGFEDSGSESDEEAGKIRRKGKKRRVQNDNIAALAQNEETQAFAKEYNAAHEDDDDFAHLKQDVMDLDTQEPESEEEREVVTAESLREQLREAARAEKEAQAFNPHDTSWVEDGGDSDDEMDVEMRVREVAADAVTSTTRGTTNRSQEKTAAMGEGDRARLARWAKSENSSRTAGVVGRNTGGSAAVTGHAKSKSGSGSFKGARPSAASSSTSGKSNAKLAKAPSVLSAVSNRRAKFAN